MEYRKFTAEEKQAFAAAYAKGAILKELAAQAQVSIPTMAKYIRAGGGTLRKPGIAKPEEPKVLEPVVVLEPAAEPTVSMVEKLGPIVDRDGREPARTILSFE